MGNAGIYVRISVDREGAGLGVARQTDDCRALAERKGWHVVEVYADNDVSAYSGAPRPEWERLLGDVKAGTVDAVVCWHVDRLTRAPRELEDVIDLADRHGLELATVSGEVDLATPTGRMVARILGAAARHESEHKGERQRRQRRQAAEAGKLSGGGWRPFGYADDRVTVVENEAAVVRECAARVLAGETLSSICRDLADRDVQTPAGNHWQVRTLRRLLASARISGRREHTPRSSYQGTRPLLGDIVCDVAAWPAIITPADSDRLRTLLSDPARRKVSPTAVGRRYLLSGILRCAECEQGMVGRPRSGVPRYVCPNTPGGRSCGSLATNAARTDDYVRDVVLTALDSPEMAERLRRRKGTDPDAIDKALRDDEEQLEELAAAWSAREITRGEWKVARAPIIARIERLREQRARTSRTVALESFLGTFDEMLARWERMNVSQRRVVVGAVVESITVNRADPRKRWDPDRFDPPVWRV